MYLIVAYLLRIIYFVVIPVLIVSEAERTPTIDPAFVYTDDIRHHPCQYNKQFGFMHVH